MEEQRYPVSQADFETIRENDFVYVDKTEYIYHLVCKPGYYFLGRPRRFGKSLLISTIKAYFEGKRGLFKGLAIDRLQPGEWVARPVLRLDLSADIYTERDSLTNALSSILSRWEKACGITDLKPTLSKRFEDVILAMEEYHGSKVVILIDEYDSPLSAAIDKPELFGLYRDQLHGFYSVLKAMEPHIQFCMLTGVTKFGKVSVFSGLNNLNDITLDNRYAGICGITEVELHECFDPGIARLAEEEGWSIPETYDMLKHSYDGYHFSRKLLDIYNPYSVLNALDKSEIKSYWCSSGIPTLLSKLLWDTNYRLEDLNGSQVSEETLDNMSVYQKNPVSLFFQTGYLTIKAYDRDLKMYTLGYPNREVERGILSNILGLYMPDGEDANTTTRKLRECRCNVAGGFAGWGGDGAETF